MTHPDTRSASGAGDRSGSLHLAVQNTAKSYSGSGAAKREQRAIIAVLLERGGTASDTDAKGKTVDDAAGLRVRLPCLRRR